MRRLGFIERRRLSLRARRRLRRLRARRRARDAADPRHLRRPAPVRSPTSSRRADLPPRPRCACGPRASPGILGVPLRRRRSSPTSSRACASPFDARRRRLRRHPAVLPLRPRDRGGLHRGSRADPRLRQHSRRRAAAHVQRMLPLPEGRRSRRAIKRRRSSRATGRKSITFSFVSSATEAALALDAPAERAPITRAEPDRRAARRDAHDADAGPARDAAHQPQAQVRRACACSRSAACSRATPPAIDQPLRIGGLAYGSAAPEQWGEAARAGRLLRRQGRPRGAGGAARAGDGGDDAPGAASRAAPRRSLIDGVGCGWLGELHPRLVAAFRPAVGPGRVRSGARRAHRAGAVPVATGGIAPARRAPRPRRRRRRRPSGRADLIARPGGRQPAARDRARCCSTSTADPDCRTARKALRFLCLCRILHVL